MRKGGRLVSFSKSVGEEKGMWDPGWDAWEAERESREQPGKRQSGECLMEDSPSRWFWDGTREGVGAARKG